MHLVVAFRADGDDFRGAARRGADHGGKLADAGGAGDALGVHHSGIDQTPRDSRVRVSSGNHQRSEKIPLPALIDAEMRLESFGFEDFLVTQACLAQDFRFQRETDEILGLLALHQHLGTFLIDRDIQLALAGREQRVGLRFKIISLLLQHPAERFRLGLRQRCGMTGHRHNFRISAFRISAFSISAFSFQLFCFQPHPG